jgi:hypothetical protein
MNLHQPLLFSGHYLAEKTGQDDLPLELVRGAPPLAPSGVFDAASDAAFSIQCA